MNKTYIKQILTHGLLLLLLSLSLLSCEERIDIHTEASAPHLVIYGCLTDDITRHSIRITRSTGYFVSTKPEGISQATVTIREEGGKTYLLTENKSEPGLYQTDSHFAGKAGKTYTLNVSLDFDNDGLPEEYEATSTLPAPARVDSIDYRPSEVFDDFVEILLWGNMPDGEGNYLSLQLFVNNYKREVSLEDYVLLDDEYIGKKEIIGVPCYYHDLEDWAFEDGTLLTLQVDAIPKEYFTFISNAQDELRGGNPLFSGPPANIKTNIRSTDPASQIPISGFFTTVSRDKASVVYRE